jgi:hypothetical protein
MTSALSKRSLVRNLRNSFDFLNGYGPPIKWKKRSPQFGVAGRGSWLAPRRECTFVKSINVGDVKEHAPPSRTSLRFRLREAGNQHRQNNALHQSPPSFY